VDREIILRKAERLLSDPTPLLGLDIVKEYVQGFISRREDVLRAANDFGSPLYLIDEEAIVSKAVEFQSAFARVLPRWKGFYAMKSNPHPFLLRTVVRQGFGLDVSSGWELEQAIAMNPSRIIFSGPGKTEDELRLACRYPEQVTVLLDSVTELEKLETIATREGVLMRCGVRLMIEETGLWRKFGIPLNRLGDFFQQAMPMIGVNLRGLQFHASWNRDSSNQVKFLERLSRTLGVLSKDVLARIEFIDVGGGYWPEVGEWAHFGSTPEGSLLRCLEPRIDEGLDHRCFSSTPLVDFAQEISAALNKWIAPIVDPEIYVEPGRWISNGSMHILLRVEDVKAEDVVITDGATSAVGWERYEMDYCPVINVSQPSTDERLCTIFGSLCTPHDLWGYSYFGKKITRGDFLLIPDQGAYTYALRQRFIKSLPGEVILSGGALRRVDNGDGLR
jgi:diaminopimelate decarboxylase